MCFTIMVDDVFVALLSLSLSAWLFQGSEGGFMSQNVTGYSFWVFFPLAVR